MAMQLQSTYLLPINLLMESRTIREKVREEIIELQKTNPRFKPGLAIVQVGSRPDSSTYVRMKGKAAQEVHSPSFIAFEQSECAN